MTEVPSPPPVTDTPVAPASRPPVPWPDQVKSFVGDLARPFAIIWTSGAAGIAIVELAKPGINLIEAAVYITAVLAGVAALYGAKAWENARAGKQSAEVAIAQANNLLDPRPGDTK